MELFYIEKVLNGDLSHFSYFIKTYKHMAYTLAFRILRNREDAEDVVQESFLKAFKSLGKFNREAKFSTWFYRIVVNTSMSNVRSRKKELYDITDEGVSDAVIEKVDNAFENIAREEQRKMIHRALEELEPEDSLLLTLYYLNENTLSEVVEITGIKAENAKMKLHRARKKMYFVMNKMVKSEIYPIA